MTTPTANAETEVRSSTDSAIVQYQLLCFASLFVLLIVLSSWRQGAIVLVPIAAGAVGLMLRWRFMPLLLLFVVAALQAASIGLFQNQRSPTRGYDLGDWFLAPALLAYTAGHYRIQALAHSVFPAPRKRKKTNVKTKVVGTPAKQTAVAAPWELVAVLMSLAVFTILAHVCHVLLMRIQPRIFGLEGGTARAVILLWTIAIVLTCLAGTWGYLRLRRLSRIEAKIIIYHAAWSEMRREQRRVARWISWRNRRGQGE